MTVVAVLLRLGFAQYQPQSEYLLYPEKNIDYIIDEAEYWTQFYDSTYGGFFSFVDGNGTVTREDVKALCPQSRLGYAYARAFMVTGDERYLDYAHRALKFLYQHGWDESNDGWYFTTNRSGAITDDQGWWDKWNTTQKQAFQQHYALLGPAAICEATGGKMDWGVFLDDPSETTALSDWDWVMRGYTSLMEHMWDSRTDYAGHYYIADMDWSNPRDKGFTPTGDAMTTNAIILYLLTEDQDIKNRMLTLADNITEHLVASMDDSRVKFGFAEDYDSDWQINANKHKNLLGHVYKAAWCVSRAYLIDPQEKYKSAAQKLLNHMWNDGGYDTEYGGPYKKYDWESGVVIDSSKNHWTLEQAVLSGLINYDMADDQSLKDRYLQIADESMDFYMSHIRDYSLGGSYSETNRAGIEISDSTKGNVFGANYHATELAYFTYLYGNLFLRDTTVTLYYYFQSMDSEQNISLYPLAFNDDKLKIKEVIHNDTLYSAFNRDTRTLTLTAGTGGKFKVTFESETTPISIVADGVIAKDFILYNNYPNPFNPETVISYQLPALSEVEGSAFSQVKLTVYNALGQEIKTLVNERQPAGRYKVRFNAGNLPSGVYFYRLSNGKTRQTKKMILIQ